MWISYHMQRTALHVLVYSVEPLALQTIPFVCVPVGNLSMHPSTYNLITGSYVCVVLAIGAVQLEHYRLSTRLVHHKRPV